MGVLSIVVGTVLALLTAWDAFESAVMPRSVISFFRFTRYFHKLFWWLWVALSRLCDNRGRELILGMYGPLATLLLIPIWALGLVLGIALVQWGLDALTFTKGTPSFPMELLNTASCFVTLGLQRQDASLGTRTLAVVTAGIGLGFLALIISYMPTLYQAFSRRESGILLLDSRAGSPPCGAELIRRHAEIDQIGEENVGLEGKGVGLEGKGVGLEGKGVGLEALCTFLQEAERWCAELLESHLSYPTLLAYRSQHDRVSWLSTITALLDATALLKVGLDARTPAQRRLAWRAYCCYAMARHAVVDINYIKVDSLIKADSLPRHLLPDRLPDAQQEALAQLLEGSGVDIGNPERWAALRRLRQEYEPYVQRLAETLLLELPPWLPPPDAHDNWESGMQDQAEHFYRVQPFRQGEGKPKSQP
jgi:hypothetical protein